MLTNDGETVHRFPRFDPERLPEVIARYEHIGRLGLPAPTILASEHGKAGQAHLVLQRETGQPWREALVDMSAIQRQRAGTQMADLLQRTRHIGASDWPFTNASWPKLWWDLQDRLRESSDQAVSVTDHQAVRDAAATAERAPLGLIHGDLAWGNILLSEEGNITAVLDWDFAVLADPAIDVAAVTYEIPEDMRQAFADEHPQMGEDLRRFDNYLATWDLQHRLWQQQPQSAFTPLQSVETER
ncbi:MAG: aminoglycoside phosphotransferase family protein [Planctomycetaceae bacterium]